MNVKMRLLSLATVAVIIGVMTVRAEATNDYIPELRLTKADNSNNVTCDIGISMASEDKQFDVDFKKYDNSNLKNGSADSVGNQEILSYGGEYNNPCYHIHDTFNTWQGNEWWTHYNQTKSQFSRFLSGGTCYPENGQWVSIALTAKSTGGSHNYIESCTEAADATYHGRLLTGITYAEDVDFTRSRPSQVKVNIEPEQRNTGIWSLDICTYSGTVTDHTLDTSIASGTLDTATGIMQLNTYWNTQTRLRSIFKAGDPVLQYNWLNVNKGRDIPADNQWHRINYNVKLLNDTSTYDFPKDGMRTYFRSLTDSDMYVSSISVGYASQVEVLRDNESTPVYKGYDSQFVDKSINTTPNQPVITAYDTGIDNAVIKLSSNAKTETHSYKARSLGSKGNNPSVWSAPVSVTTTSIPNKYHIKLYKNNKLVKDEDTSLQDYVYSDVKEGDKLTGEIYTIDEYGKQSVVTPINYTVKQTLKDYKAAVKKLETDTNKIKRQYSYEEKKDIKDNVTKTANELRTNRNLDSYKATTMVNGLDDATEFQASDKLVSIYIK